MYIILLINNAVDWNMGACLYGFELLNSRVAALFVAGTSRIFLICFGVHYWFVHLLYFKCIATALFFHGCHRYCHLFLSGIWGTALVMQ